MSPQLNFNNRIELRVFSGKLRFTGDRCLDGFKHRYTLLGGCGNVAADTVKSSLALVRTESTGYLFPPDYYQKGLSDHP
jgi:hypothetical protein